MRVAVIIPAAGSSRRYSEGAEFPRSKLDEDLGGRPVLQRTVELFTKVDVVSAIIVAGPADPAALDEFRARHADKLGLLGVTICPGGRTHRFETVAAALAHVPADATHVGVHDAARPCTPLPMIERLFEAAGKYPAVVPAIDASDTLKRVGEREATDADVDPLDAILGPATRVNVRVRVVEFTIDRSRLVAVQTPQVFGADLLRRAYAALAVAATRAGFCAPTDDAEAVERLGEAVTVVEGDPRNIKITRPIDAQLARSILGLRDNEHRPVHKRF